MLYAHAERFDDHPPECQAVISRLRDVKQAEANMLSMTELSLASWETGHREAKTPQGNT